MDPGVLKTAFVVMKYTQVVLLLGLSGLSIYATTESTVYGLLSMPTLLFLFVYLILFRVNITNEVVKQERNILIVLFFMYAVILAGLSSSFLSIVRGNGTVSQNSEKSPDSLTMHNANETFSYPIFKNLSKTEELSGVVRKTNGTVNFDDGLSNKETRKDDECFELIYNIAMALIFLLLVFQAILWALAWMINSLPADNLDIEVGLQNEEILVQPISPANDNLQAQPDSGERYSSVQNVIIHRKPRASEENVKESSMEDSDGVDYDSLTIAGPSMELGTSQKEKEETFPESNLSETAVTLKGDLFQEKSGIKNIPKVVITETSSQEDLNESNK